MKHIILLLLATAPLFAQYRQLAGSSGSVAGKATSASVSSTAICGQPIVGGSVGGEFGTRSGISSIFDVTVISLAVPGELATLPTEFTFAQNFPNPFNPSTSFEFALPKASSATLIIYDQLGREAVRVFERELPAGAYATNFVAPSSWASGVYFAVFRAGAFNQVRKIVLLK